MASSIENQTGDQVIIIHKSYTPHKAEYNKKYYHEHREKLLARKERQKKEAEPEFKEKKKQYQEKYMEKLKNNPERLEKFKQYYREYYQKTKLVKTEDEK